jgi:autotransporter adhesin
LLANAAAGAPITLQALDVNGNIVGPAAQCNSTSDTISLNTPAGIAIGGNMITGLGGNLQASAADLNAIAFGNNAQTTAAATGSVAIGQNAQASVANSVALGAGAVAARGANTNYTAYGLSALQTSSGEFSVGQAGNTRQITNVAAGSAGTDAVNVNQLTAVGTVAANSVQYDLDGLGNRTNVATLVGGAAGPVALRNVAAGTLGAASTDAVNGSQLFATNAQVTTNTSNVTNILNGTAGLVQQTGGAPGVGVISVGAATAGTVVDFGGTAGTRRLIGISAGIAPTDAVNLSQLNTFVGAGGSLNAVQYNVDVLGNRTNTVSLVGGNTAAPVTINNVAAGALNAASSDAVNGAQLSATNTAVTNNTTAIGGLTTNISNGTIGLVQQTGGAPGNGALTVGAATGGTVVNVAGTAGPRTISGVKAGVAATDAANVGQVAAASSGAVQYDRNVDGSVNRTSITVGSVGAPATIGNVAVGVRAADAVNVGQLQAGLSSTLNQANSYTDARVMALSFDLDTVAKRAYAGTAAAIALQAPALFAPGQVSMRVGTGLYRGQVAVGASMRATADNGRWSVTGGVSGGRNAGVAASAGVDFIIGN